MLKEILEILFLIALALVPMLTFKKVDKLTYGMFEIENLKINKSFNSGYNKKLLLIGLITILIVAIFALS